PKYTITFDDGSETAQTVTLEEGTAITADQIPAAQTIEGKTFDGWFIGETKVEAGYKPTANVTATAKYSTVKVTVKFVNGDAENSVTVDYNTAIAQDKLPANAQPVDSRILAFDGWYDGETKFTSDMTFKEDATFEAKFERIAYIVTIKNDAAEQDPIEKIVAKNPNGATVLPAGLLPTGANVPTVANKIFLGFYNGAIKMAAGAEISGDLTLVASYVGEDDYSGVWVDEAKKVVIYFDDEEGNLYVGKDDTYISNLTFDPETGKMEYVSSYSTSWTLSIAGDTLTVVKTPRYGDPSTFKATKAEGDVHFKGAYLRDNKYSNTITFIDGGYAIADYYGIQYQYAKLELVDGEYQFIVYDEEGNKTAVDASVDMVAGTVTAVKIGGNLTVAGLWIKDSEIEFIMQDSESGTKIIKHDVDGTYVYVFVDKDLVYSVVNIGAGNEITDGGTPGSEVITLTFPDESQLFIKVTYTNYSTSYELAGAESGTYSVVGGVANQKLILDGFGTAKFSDAVNTYAYEVIGENQIYIEELDSKYQLNGTECSIVAKDKYAGVYYQLDNTFYSIKLDGYGTLIANSLYSYDDPIDGTYVVNNDNTITISGIESDNFKDGVYEILFDGETLCLNGKYYGKEAESKLEIMAGKWIDSADNSIVIEEGFYGPEITVNGSEAGNIIIHKYDKSAMSFQAGGEIYNIALGDMVNGNYTLNVSVSNVDSVYTAAPAAISALFGNWTNDGETMKVAVVDKYTVQVDFSATEDTLIDAELIASNATEKTITVKANGVSYTIQIVNATTIQVDSADNTFSVTLNKPVISNSDSFGKWTWNDANMDPAIGTIEITANGITINDIAAEDIVDNDTGYFNLSFTFNGKRYTIYKQYSFSSATLQLDATYDQVTLTKVEE
ncbi:MAG: InlB B-repeat-containing protein, partial [Clostridia bacterium]|nr:InlB B-repeat-containing protein [Clostridia bacterium]